MKFFQAFVSMLVGAVVLTLAAGANAQSGTKSGYATIVRIQGEARYSAGDNVWHPLTAGQTLGPGNVIQTGTDSRVDMVLGDRITEHLVPVPDKVSFDYDGNVRDLISYKAVAKQNVIRMYSDTVLAIDKLLIYNTGVDAVHDTELDLRQGTIFGTVKKLSAESQYRIKTPNGIAGVRGTTFLMSANGDITVTAGSIVAAHTDANGQTTTVVLGPGDRYDPATGQITHLTKEEFDEAMQTAVLIITLEEGIISYAYDQTVLYVSPVRGDTGVNANHGGWSWPF